MLYCETVFAITEYPANQPIVKRPEAGIGGQSHARYWQES